MKKSRAAAREGNAPAATRTRISGSGGRCSIRLSYGGTPGATDGTRTRNHLIHSQVLYHLSYGRHGTPYYTQPAPI